jgi:hypothetical protein
MFVGREALREALARRGHARRPTDGGYDYWLRSLVWEMKVRGWLLEVLVKGHLYTVGDG